ncbi:MAG: hypothetical protein GY722_11490 [bacterium]|nr:hypothetical protein [bacterium]
MELAVLSLGELQAVCSYLETGMPPRLEADWNELTQSEQGHARAVATQSLEARGLVVDGIPAGELTALVAAFAFPGLLALVRAYRDGSLIYSDGFSVNAELSVAHREISPGAHALKPIATADVRDLILDLVGAGDENSDTSAAVTVDEAVLAGWLEDPAEGEMKNADDPGPLRQALRTGATLISVAVAHSPTAGRIEGEEVVWIETEGGAQYEVDRIGGGGLPRVHVKPVAAPDLRRHLSELIPNSALVE